jgi:hypothetical protein
MKIFRIVNKVLLCLLALDGISALIAIMLGYTHQWVVVLMACILYLILWHCNKDTED